MKPLSYNVYNRESFTIEKLKNILNIEKKTYTHFHSSISTNKT